MWGDELGMRGGLGVGVYCSGETERVACVVGGLPCARERGWRWHMFCVVCDCGGVVHAWVGQILLKCNGN